MKSTLLFILAGALMMGCAIKTQITTTQLHIVTAVDTVGKKNVRIKIEPIAPPTSSMGNGLKVGDTVKVLTSITVKY